MATFLMVLLFYSNTCTCSLCVPVSVFDDTHRHTHPQPHTHTRNGCGPISFDPPPPDPTISILLIPRPHLAVPHLYPIFLPPLHPFLPTYPLPLLGMWSSHPSILHFSTGISPPPLSCSPPFPLFWPDDLNQTHKYFKRKKPQNKSWFSADEGDAN